MALSSVQLKWYKLLTKLGVSSSISYKPDVVFVSKYNPLADYSDLPAAYSALPSTGGTIELDNVRPGDAPYSGSFTITKPNVSILGKSAPVINWDSETIINSTPVIEGTVLVRANGFTAERCAFQTLVTAGDGLQLRHPSFVADNTNSGSIYLQGAEIHNCAFLGLSRSASFHGLLIEDYQHVNFSNIQTVRNTWGVALKSSHVKGTSVKGKNHSNGVVVTKADFAKTVTDVTVSGISYESTVDNSGSYGGGVWLQNYSSGSHLIGITYNDVMIRNGTFNLSNANGSLPDGMDAITVNGLTVNNLGQTQLDCVSMNNAVCTGSVTINGAKLRGGASSVNDVSLVFRNFRMPFPDHDKGITAIPSLPDTPMPFRYTKLGFTSGVNLTFLNIAYTGNDTNVFELHCNTQSPTILAYAKFDIRVTYNVINNLTGSVVISPVSGSLQTSTVASHVVSAMAITATVNPTTKVIQLGFSATNNNSEFMNLTYTLAPVGVSGKITPLPQ